MLRQLYSLITPVPTDVTDPMLSRLPATSPQQVTNPYGLREEVWISLSARTGDGPNWRRSMNLSAYWKPSLLLLAFAAASATEAESVDTSVVAETIKTEVAQLVAGINAHDPAKATAYDALNVISMECDSPSTIGVEADREGFKAGFAHDPFWKVSLIDETVDVASS